MNLSRWTFPLRRLIPRWAQCRDVWHAVDMDAECHRIRFHPGHHDDGDGHAISSRWPQ